MMTVLEMTTVMKVKSSIKNKHAQFWLLCDFPILFAFYNICEIRHNWTGARAAESNTEK